jgi:hypothetical protein
MVGILFRSAMQHASVTQHAIARATGQKLALGRAGRFRTTRCEGGLFVD